jgi:AraC-like DNA-binding protein
MGRGYSPSTGSARDFYREVTEVVRKLLPDSPLNVETVAGAVRTSPRTLQRRLNRAGFTFAGVLQRARYAAARRMLRNSNRKIGEIGRVLGYSDPAHFTRAFTRWTGVTPEKFRRSRSDLGTAPPQRARRPR